MDNRRNSHSSCADNTHTPGIHSRIPGIRSCCNDIRDNRSRCLRLQCQLKLERRLALLEPERVLLLPMELKEAFSCVPPMFEFSLYCVFHRDRKLLDGAHRRISESRPLPFLSDSNTNDVAVPLATKIQTKLDLNLKQNFVEKSACSSWGEGEGIARLQPQEGNGRTQSAPEVSDVLLRFVARPRD